MLPRVPSRSDVIDLWIVSNPIWSGGQSPQPSPVSNALPESPQEAVAAAANTSAGLGAVNRVPRRELASHRRL